MKGMKSSFIYVYFSREISMICLGKIRNSLTIVEYLRILGISELTNLRSPIREFFRVLIVYGKQSSYFCKKNICTFCRHGSKQQFIMKWLILDLLDVVWYKYGIHIFPSCHHMRYVGRNHLESLLVKFFSFRLFFSSLFEMALGSHRRHSSILTRHAWPRKSLQGQGIRPFSLK